MKLLILLLFVISCAQIPEKEKKEEGTEVQVPPVTADIPAPTVPETESKQIDKNQTSSWAINISGDNPKLILDRKYYDVDLFDNPKSFIEKIPFSVCYFSSQWEDWRPDSKEFPSEALGNKLDKWPGEKWLNPKHPKVIELLLKRVELAKSKGCDAVDLDNIDSYTYSESKVGFKITMQDDLNLARKVCEKAASLGLGFAQKNGLEMIPALKDCVTLYINESCQEYKECDAYKNVGKPVLNIEYGSCKNYPYMYSLRKGSLNEKELFCSGTIPSNNTEVPKNEIPKTTGLRRGTLPSGINEASGIAYSPVKKEFYIINDSGNSGDLFVLGEDFKLKKQVKTGLKNIDFEAVAYSDGKIYIGDIGSNDESRSSKIVYVLNEADFKLIETIKIPMVKDFNAEGMAIWNGEIYLSEKNYDDEPNGIWKFSNGKLVQYTQLVMPKYLGSLGDMAINSKGEFIFPAVDKGDGTAWVWSAGKLNKISVEKLGQIESMTWVSDDKFVYTTEGENEPILEGSIQ